MINLFKPKHLRFYLLLIIAIIFFLSANIWSQKLFRQWQLDFTDNQVYSLSNSAYRLAQSIDEPIKLKLFYSKKITSSLPNFAIYAERVERILEEFVSASDGKITLEKFDPQPFSQEEDLAVSYGLQAVPLNKKGDTIYFGLVGVNSIDENNLISFFTRERETFLEYDIAKLIYDLNHSEKPKIGLITSLPVLGTPGNPMMGQQGQPEWTIFSQLKDFYDITVIQGDESILDKDVKAILLIHPKNLTEQQLYNIDQFVLHGGKLLVALDPFSEVEASLTPSNPNSQNDFASNFGKLAKHWGIDFQTNEVLGDLRLAQTINIPGERGDIVEILYLPWLNIPANQFNANDPIMGSLEQLNLASSGSLKVLEGSPLSLTPLIESSKEVMKVEKQNVMQSPDPAQLLRNFTSLDQKQVIAARLSGHTSSAFTLDEVKALQPGSKHHKHRDTSVDSIDLVFIADTDFLFDAFWIRKQEFFGQTVTFPVASNGNLLLNSVENLTGSDALSEIRAKQSIKRPFEVIEQLERKAEIKFREKEKVLSDQLAKTEEKLAKLQKEMSKGNEMLLSSKQEAEIQSFRNQAVEIRKQLREVQFSLRQDIELLQNKIIWLNTLVIPFLLIILASSIALYRRKKRQQKFEG